LTFRNPHERSVRNSAIDIVMKTWGTPKMLNTERFRRKCSAVAVFVAVSLVSAAPGDACAEDAVEPSPEKGQALAQKLCSGCHLIEEMASSATPAGIPTFRAIANRPGQTGQHITSVLIQPHTPMPDIHLSREEILNIVSYLETLRTDKSMQPLLPPTKYGPKPKYPEPS
jgi:mono/diheme cytochrome c family protein